MRRGHRQRISRVQAGVILVVVMVLVTYFGFTKAVPFKHHFEIKADFRSAVTLRKDSAVRIGGVDVGKVTKIDRLEDGGDGVRVTMRIKDMGRPIHKDATAKLRPRIFLEGNLFVDISPGSPSAPALGDGDVIPVGRTSTPVQLDQILTSLQADTRRDLQVLLQELNTGLEDEGAIGFNKSIQYWTPAFRGSAVVNEATLGTQEHDLSNYIKHAGTVAGALDRDPDALKNLITDFNTTAAAFAVQQQNLERTVAELPRTLRAAQPALASLNRSFPPLRRLIVDFRPAVRSSGPTIDASMPFIRQARLLVRDSELRGLTRDLRPLVPDLARLNRNLVPLFRQTRLASSCQNDVVLPWSRDTVPDAKFPATGKVYQEAVTGLPGLGAESRSGDANGQWARVVAGNGSNVYALGGADQVLGQRFGVTNFPLEGVNPPKSPRPPSRYDVPCETQEPPDLRSKPDPPPQAIAAGSGTPRMLALNRANQFEGIGDSFMEQGKEAQAKQWYAKAHDMREKNNLLGMQWDIVGGKLKVVDPKQKKLSPAGAPLVAPFVARQDSASAKDVEEKLSKVRGAAQAGEGGR